MFLWVLEELSHEPFFIVKFREWPVITFSKLRQTFEIAIAEVLVGISTQKEVNRINFQETMRSNPIKRTAYRLCLSILDIIGTLIQQGCQRFVTCIIV